MKKRLLQISIFVGLIFTNIINSDGQITRADTYCNPLNIDYTYMIYNSDENISYRSGADPAVVKFRGEYYMFVTRSMGYWHSQDLLNWDFIHPEKWYFQGSNAPAAHNYKDSVLYVTGDPSGNMSILYTDNPLKGDWKTVPSILKDLQDPDLFIDNDGQAYMFWGSSNVYPIRGRKLNMKDRFLADKNITELFNLDPLKHGWERFGENNSDTLKGYIEGAWMNRHNGRYYLQYAAPGTEFNVYADGVYLGDHPLGPYQYAPNNPFSFKPGGFINGAGHGSTVQMYNGDYWHFATMSLSVNMNWERRICMFPTFFDKEGLMYCNVDFGDYPHYAPDHPEKKGQFTGWMLLSYKKPVKSSSTKENFKASAVTDENVKTFWVAEENDEKQWLEIDLGKAVKIYAIQVNYFDYKSNIYGKVSGLYHRYFITGSMDGKNWKIMVDKRDNFRDVPNDYVQLSEPKMTRFIRYNNIRVPSANLAISDLRIFGTASGKVPLQEKNFQVTRNSDRRDAFLQWQKQENAQGYLVRWGIAPDKLYNSWMVYEKNSLTMRCLSTDQEYYFDVLAFNENGIGQPAFIVQVK
jgi:hypothetical protein